MNSLKLKEEQLFISWKNRSIDFLKAYQEQDVSLMLKSCDRTCQVSFIPLGDNGKGNAHEVGKAIWDSLIECFPDIDNTVHNATYMDDAVHCEVTIRGKQAKDFAGITCKERNFEEDHIFVFKVNDHGLISSIAVDWDHDSFVKQLS